MSKRLPTPTEAIIHAARECEDAARLALFADEQDMPGMAESLRKLAAYHSQNAFEAAKRVQS